MDASISSSSVCTEFLFLAIDNIDWFHEDRWFAICFVDGTLKLGKLESAANIITYKAHNSYITSIKWESWGLMYATASFDRTCKIWKEHDDGVVLLHTLKHNYEPISLEWSPRTGETDTPLLLAVGTSLGTVCVWRLSHKSDVKPQLVSYCHFFTHHYSNCTLSSGDRRSGSFV